MPRSDPAGTIRDRSAMTAANVIQGVGVLVAVGIALTVGSSGGIFGVGVVCTLAFYGLMALGLNAMLGYAGLFCLATGALAGLGAYSYGAAIETYELSHAVAVILGLLVPVAAGGLVGLLSVRLGAMYFALATFFLNEIVITIIGNTTSITGGLSGLIVEPITPGLFGLRRDQSSAVIGVVLVVAAGLALARFHRSRLGVRLQAVREDPSVAEAVGVSAFTMRMVAITIGSTLSGLAGMLYSWNTGYLDPGVFNFSLSLFAVTIVVIGGRDSILGSLCSTALLVGVPLAVAELGSWTRLISGVVLVVVVLVEPGGLAGFVRRIEGLVRSVLGRWRPGDPPLEETVGQRDDVVLRRGDAGSERASAPGVPALAVAGITVRFGEFEAVADVGFELEAGRILGIMGPNGAGKTTLLNAVSGFAPITGGRIELHGQEVTSLSPHGRARAGLVRTFQSARLLGELDVATALDVPTATGVPDTWRREVIELLGLERWLDRPTSSLPAGVQRLVGIGMALMADPRVLLLDEPAAGLNTAEEALLKHAVIQIRAAGVTVVMVEHSVAFLLSVSDEVVVMASGRVISAGPPDHVRRDPAVQEAYLGFDVAVTT